MSLLRALRAYVGLGPDEDYENRYLDDYGNRVDIDLTGRNPGTTHEFAQSGVVAGGRPEAGGRRARAEVGHGTVTNSSRTSSRPRSPSGNEHRGTVVRSEPSQVVGSASSPDVPFPHSPSAPSRTDESEPARSARGDNAGSEPTEAEGHEPDANPQGAVVRSIESARTRPKTVSPESFADAKTVGDDFKLGTPIVLNLQGLERDLARRLIDFASGLCYALDGSMEKLAVQVFLLTPHGIEVSESDRLRIEQRGYAR